MINMSYCAVENTTRALEELLDLVVKYDNPIDWYNDLSDSEQSYIDRLNRVTDQFQEVCEQIYNSDDY